jgi:hypothetical protein
MGVSFSPGGAQWDHFSYGAFRRRLAILDGIDLDKMRGFSTEDLPRDWEDYPTALEPLLNSSDVHGFISAESCRRMLPRLRVVAEQWSAAADPNDNEAFDLQALRSLIDGMEHCADHGCALQYG